MRPLSDAFSIVFVWILEKQTIGAGVTFTTFWVRTNLTEKGRTILMQRPALFVESEVYHFLHHQPTCRHKSSRLYHVPHLQRMYCQ
jgi:hypothetical protein